MKRTIIFSVMLLALTSIITMQSCKKETVQFTVHHAFTVPVVSAPANGVTLKISGTTVDLTWASTNADGDAILADVYFGTSSNPPLYKANLNSLTLTVPVTLGLSYHWYVVMKDANGVTVTSPTWSFTVFEPIGIFVGSFNCDEPAEAYSYGVSFTKTSDNTLKTTNYWNSGWTGIFTLNFTANTYSMPLTTFQTGWTGLESGTINPANGKMVGTYTIWQNGVLNETGVHTYTKL